MQWYSGGIAEAITVSKAKGAIFVVYIEGTDDQSKKITDLIDNQEVSKKLETENFVAIKITAGSVPHQQFSEIFKEPSVPSVYFIGKNGTPLDIVMDANDLQSLSQRIDNVLKKAGINVVHSTGELSENLIRSEQSSPSSNIVCENDVCTIRRDTNAATSSGSGQAASLTPEEKIERAKELAQKKREEKEREEKEKEIEKEIERRKMGQSVQQMKKWQEDQELKQILEQREKEKRENQLARERVLAQIAQDKAERQSRSKPPTSEVVNKPPVLSPRPNTYTTRLQFKLPDGRSTTQEFSNSDALQTVVTYIRENMNLPFSDFRLSTTFPRREFTANDYSQSLLDLQLTPNAVVLVLPVSRGTVSTNQGGTLTNLFWSLVGPIFQIFGYLRTFVFGGNPSTGGEAKKKSSGEESSSGRPEQSRQFQRPRDSTVIKRQGNVHRLGDRRDSDDESNTWNGNSTQQM